MPPTSDDVIVVAKRVGACIWRRNERTQQLERVVNLVQQPPPFEERALADGIVLRREPNGTLWRRTGDDDDFVCVWRSP